MSKALPILLAGVAVAACTDNSVVVVPIVPPQNLYYVLDPSGDPSLPAGTLLRWDPVSAPDLLAYRVYSRSTASATYSLRGETTSLSFHDTGIPDLYYAVSSVATSGAESDLREVLVDERLRLQAPNALGSTSLNGAVFLAWDDNAYLADPQGFYRYRVYSAAYSLDDNLCDVAWVLEGTTVAPEFIAGALTNGIARCFGVSAESVEGWESMWSPIRADTPRPDARNIVLYADAVDPNASAFRFHDDLNNDGVADPNELGRIGAATSPAMDFVLERDASQNLFFVPRRTNTTVALYGNQPVDDLTAIDLAPLGGYATSGIQVSPGFGYVFQMDGGDGFWRYGAVRPTHVGQDFIIFDWSYQPDPGNPELAIHGGVTTASAEGVTVRRR